ncbi:MAG: ATP-binding cassette domain-containing protein, partial [Cellulomonadaceae bacterium]|nr:ATP-binding cassette domain-containing protein [Cellulomonadaceae bacterium]
RLAGPLRERLAAAVPAPLPAEVSRPSPAPLVATRGLHVRYPATWAVRGVDLEVCAGEVVSVMGRNGAGKSSLLWALAGAGPRAAGSVQLGADGADPARLGPRESRRRIALVPQEPRDLLYLDTVEAECMESDEQADARPGTTASLLRGFARLDGAAHPRDLSEGERLSLVLAVQLAANPDVLLLDEPTRGLDRTAKSHLATILGTHAAGGGAVILSSHDVEFVAECATRVVVLAGGEVVADGTAREVLVASPTFAPQVAKVLHPLELLTVAAVRAALAVTA